MAAAKRLRVGAAPVLPRRLCLSGGPRGSPSLRTWAWAGGPQALSHGISTLPPSLIRCSFELAHVLWPLIHTCSPTAHLHFGPQQVHRGVPDASPLPALLHPSHQLAVQPSIQAWDQTGCPMGRLPSPHTAWTSCSPRTPVGIHSVPRGLPWAWGRPGAHQLSPATADGGALRPGGA